MKNHRWGWPLGAWLISRLITSAAAASSATFIDQGKTIQVAGYVPPHLHGVAQVLAGVWLRADALWYLKIASHGYGRDPSSFAFYPLYPTIVRVFSFALGGRVLYAALVIAGVSFAVGLVLFFELAKSLLDEKSAKAATLGVALFPTAFFFAAPYAESMFLAFAAAALLSRDRGKPSIAFVSGSLAALTRPFGIFLAIPLLMWKRDGRWSGIGPLAGAIGWFVLAGIRLNDPFAALRVQSIWQRHPEFPLNTISLGISAWVKYRRSDYGPYFLMDLVVPAIVLIGAGVTFLALRNKKRGSEGAGLALYNFAVLVGPLATIFPGRPFLSMPRFVLAAFPAGLGASKLPRWSKAVMATLSAISLGWLTMLFVAARPIF